MLKSAFSESKEWAKASVQKGGKAAHAFSRVSRSDRTSQFCIDDELGPLPINGELALIELLDQWLPLWHKEGRLDSHHPYYWDVFGQELPPISSEQLRRVCRSYGDGAGLGWDSFHPRQILFLPEEYQLRVIGVLHHFEDRPCVITEFLTQIIFLDNQTEESVRLGSYVCSPGSGRSVARMCAVHGKGPTTRPSSRGWDPPRRVRKRDGSTICWLTLGRFLGRLRGRCC